MLSPRFPTYQVVSLHHSGAQLGALRGTGIFLLRGLCSKSYAPDVELRSSTLTFTEFAHATIKIRFGVLCQ